MTAPDDASTVYAARWWVSENINEGVTCPCCGQFAKAYRRKISAPMARVLIDMYRVSEFDWVYLPSLRSAGQDEALARHWGIIDAKPGLRPDGARQQGWWALTARGQLWVEGKVAIPKYARIYNSQLVGLEGPDVTIKDALGSRFNYDELMRGV